jgi:hypothetical protein
VVVESALEGELDDHLGYGKHDPAGRDGGNSRNGRRGKSALTEAGPVSIEVPRDREGSFEPRLVKKRQRRLTGLDNLVISLSAKGLTHGAIGAHLAEVYGASVSKQTISTITDWVIVGMAEWQSRPLDSVLAFLQLNERSCLGAAVEQQRPDMFVFADVVMVQDGTHPLDVIGDDLCAVVVAGRDTTDESGHQRELAAEHVVHYQHVAAVEVRAARQASPRNSSLTSFDSHRAVRGANRAEIGSGNWGFSRVGSRSCGGSATSRGLAVRG